MPAGSEQTWGFQFTYITAAGQQAPWPGFSSLTWEYVVRDTATSPGTPLFSITTTANSSGVIVVTSTSTLSQVGLYIYPAATATLTPQAYAHSLWSDPGTDTALTWWTGDLIVEGAAQP